MPSGLREDRMKRMASLVSLPKRRQTPGEEIANSISHGFGFAAGAIVAPFLIVAAVRYGDTAFLVGASVFAAAIG
jgi:hemolysin III